MPNTIINTLLISFQDAKPNPSFQKTTISITIGNIIPKVEKNNAPTIVKKGVILGTATATATAKKKPKFREFF